MFPTTLTPLVDASGAPRRSAPVRGSLEACTLCPARCCRLEVEASFADVVEICGTLGLPFLAAFDLVRGQGPRSFSLDRDPRWVNEEDDWPGRAEIIVRRKKDGSCGFLHNFEGYDRCSAHALRPSACRLYPLAWSQGDKVGGPPAVLCAVPYAVSPERERRFVADLRRSRARWALHEAIAADWEALPPGSARTLESLLAFALPQAAASQDRSYGPALERGTADQRLFQAMLAAGVLPGSRR